MLSFWAEQVAEGDSVDSLEAALKKVGKLDVPLSRRQSFPDLLRGFLDYVATTGSFREAERWSDYVSKIESKYLQQFRDDGSVKGETVRQTSCASRPQRPLSMWQWQEIQEMLYGTGVGLLKA